MAKTIITLGREYCTGGRYIAEDVANALVFSRQPTHCRWGMDLGMGDCLLSVYASLSGLMSIL